MSPLRILALSVCVAGFAGMMGVAVLSRLSGEPVAGAEAVPGPDGTLALALSVPDTAAPPFALDLDVAYRAWPTGTLSAGRNPRFPSGDNGLRVRVEPEGGRPRHVQVVSEAEGLQAGRKRGRIANSTDLLAPPGSAVSARTVTSARFEAVSMRATVRAGVRPAKGPWLWASIAAMLMGGAGGYALRD